MVKTGNVEEFPWTYTEKCPGGGKPVTKEVTNLQAILINPKWADHGFDPEMQEVVATPGGCDSSERCYDGAARTAS